MKRENAYSAFKHTLAFFTNAFKNIAKHGILVLLKNATTFLLRGGSHLTSDIFSANLHALHSISTKILISVLLYYYQETEEFLNACYISI